MPSRTLEDKVEDLTKLTSRLDRGVTALEGDVKALAAHQAETDKSLADLKTTVALLAQQVQELKNWKS